jgi:hypothetical protein
MIVAIFVLGGRVLIEDSGAGKSQDVLLLYLPGQSIDVPPRYRDNHAVCICWMIDDSDRHILPRQRITVVVCAVGFSLDGIKVHSYESLREFEDVDVGVDHELLNLTQAEMCADCSLYQSGPECTHIIPVVEMPLEL